MTEEEFFQTQIEAIQNDEVANNEDLLEEKMQNNKNMEEYFEPQIPIKVYVKKNENGEIIDIQSEIFLEDFAGWEYFDKGVGDKYAHAQSQYFENRDED